MPFRIEELQPDGTCTPYTEYGGLDIAKRTAFDLANGQGPSNDYRVINTQAGDKLVAQFHHARGQTVDLLHYDVSAYLSRYLRYTWNITGLDLLRLMVIILEDDGQLDEAEGIQKWLDHLTSPKRKERSYR